MKMSTEINSTADTSWLTELLKEQRETTDSILQHARDTNVDIFDWLQDQSEKTERLIKTIIRP